jgi:tripartite-type tricarboxylate transporter receptor subunit TctC
MCARSARAKGTPAAVVRKVNGAMQAALSDPVLLRQLETEGMTAIAATPGQYAEMVRSDTERWTQLVRSLNLKAN